MSDGKTDQQEGSRANTRKDTNSMTRGRSIKLPQCCLPVNTQSLFYVGEGNGTSLVEGCLMALGWKRTTDKMDERYKLKWSDSRRAIDYTTFREGYQLVNHIPNCKLLTNKLGLLCSLQEHERVSMLINARLPRMKMADFVPETYKLDQRLDRQSFLNVYKDGETWICKPVGMNQGKGIFLLRSREEINRLLTGREARLNCSISSRAPMMRVVQRYIATPLLLEGRKFDIRSYMLIASTVPFLVLFHQGYVRLSCQKYNQEDRNLTIHLTNQYVQKKDPSYEDSKEDTVWVMSKLNSYINEKVAAEKQLEADWVYKTLTKQMERIALHCFNSVRHKLHCKMGYFDLYGMDFMVDSQMKVWLIEINSNPSLQTNCQALKEAIPCVVEHALYLAIECFEKSRKRQPLMPLVSLGGYKVLYCSSSPKTGAPRQSRSVSPLKDSTECNKHSETGRHLSPFRSRPRRSMSQVGINPLSPTEAPTLGSSKTNEKLPGVDISVHTVSIGMDVGPEVVEHHKDTTITSTQDQQEQPQQQPLLHAHVVSPSTAVPEEDCSETHANQGMIKPRDNSHRGN